MALRLESAGQISKRYRKRPRRVRAGPRSSGLSDQKKDITVEARNRSVEDMTDTELAARRNSLLRTMGLKAVPLSTQVGRRPKLNPEFKKFGEAVRERVSRFEKGKKLVRDGVSALRKNGFSSLEIDCIVQSRNPTTAAIRWACKKFGIDFRTGKNYFSRFRSERHEK